MKIFSKNKEADRVISMIEHPGVSDRIIDVVVIILCGIVAFCSVLPMWHVVMSSFSDGKLLLTHEGLVWWPVGNPTFDGYQHIFKDNGIIRGYLNSVIYTVLATLLGWFVSCTAGYALSRNTKMKKFMITFVMITMLFGGGMVPTYMVIRMLGWTGNPLSLIIPGCTNAMFIVMMMNAFYSVPSDLFEAAKIDGAGHFKILFIITLPLVQNMGMVIVLNSVVGQWNSWLPASMYVPNNREFWPLQLFIREITANSKDFLQNTNPDYSRYLIQYAVIIVASLPIILLFPLFQSKLEKAVITGGIKG